MVSTVGPVSTGPAAEEEVDEDDKRLWQYDVVIRRKGTLRLPLRIAVTFKGGAEPQYFDWSREDQNDSKWFRLPLEPSARKIESVVIDPERVYYVDANMSDNQWYDEVDKLTPWRWTERVATQYSHLLHWFARIGG